MPRKAMVPVNGLPLLAIQIERLSRVTNARLVVATTWRADDDEIVDLARAMGCACVRGDESDLLSRHLAAARLVDAEAVAIAGGDDPLLDPALFTEAIARYAVGDCDYVRTEGWPLGLDLWVVGRAGLLDGWREATAPDEREHSLPWWDARPERYRTVTMHAPRWARRDYRLTVDEAPDIELHRRILEAFPDTRFTTADVIALLDAHPEWAYLNRHVSQAWAQAPSGNHVV